MADYAPISYSNDVASPFQAAMAGYAGGAAIRNDQQQQVLQAQQQQAALAQQAALSQLANNPNAGASDYARAMTLMPGASEALKKAWDAKNADQQQSSLSDLLQWGSAIKNGQPAVAAQLMNQRADAMEAAGVSPQVVQALRAKAGIVDAHPQFALGMIQAIAGAHPNAETATKALAALEQAPADLAAKQAGAVKAGAEAAVAANTIPEATAAPGLANEETRQKVETAKANRAIAALDIQIKQANSETERGKLQLERDKLVQEQALKTQGQGQAAQDQQNSATQALQTVEQIKNHPAMTGWNRPGQWSGAMVRMLPGTERHALEGWIDSLKGQLGFANLMAAKAASPSGASGFGALSEGELKLLSNLAGNLDTNSADFPKQFASVEKFLQKSQSTAASRPGLPRQGEAFVMQHPTFGAVKEGDINRLMTQYPGATREQVLDYLKATGGK